MFVATESFFLRGSDNLAVTHKTSSAIMIKTGNTQDIHWLKKCFTD
jgi:hypothetical protein